MRLAPSRLLFALALTALTTPAFAGLINADSNISAVTVYPDRAVVTRSVKLRLPAGESVIEFKDLPPGLLENSLQVAGNGTATTILDVTAKTVLVEASPNERIRETDEKIKVIEAQIKTLRLAIRAKQRTIRAHEEDKQVLQKQLDLVSRIEGECLNAKPLPPTGKDTVAVYARPKVEDYQSLLQFSGAKQLELKAQARTHDAAIEALNDEVQTIQEQISKAGQAINLLQNQGNPQGRYSRVVSVRLDAPASGETTLNLSYATPGASWSPSYDVRLKDRAARVTYFGNVRQSTGEDWSNTKLTLSTAKPNLGGAAPSLNAWMLDVQQPRPAASPAPVASYAEKLEARDSRRHAAAINIQAVAFAKAGLYAEKKDADMAIASVALDGTHAIFKIDRPANIPSNNQSFKVSIAQVALNGKLQYQATPILNENAYLTGYFKLAGAYPFLAGPTNIFLNDTFVGSDRMPTTMPGAVLTTAFGADDGIGIKRRLADKKTETVGILSKAQRVTYTYEFTVENHKKITERVVFRDHLPVSRNAKIEVSLLAPAKSACGEKPKTTAQALALKKEVTLEDNGELCWRLDLKPGEKRVIPFKFTVEAPEGVAVSGL